MDAWRSSPSSLVPLVALLMGGVVLTVLALAKLRVTFRFVAKAEPSGAWAVVMGAESLGMALTWVSAEGVAARLLVFVLGRQVWEITARELRSSYVRRAERREAAPKKPRKPRSQTTSTVKELRAMYRRVEAWFDPVDGVAFLLCERRRVRLDWLTITTTFGAEDPTITGRISGLLYVLDTFLPNRVRLVPTPDWSPENRLSLSVEGRVALSPGLFTLDVLGFAARALVHRVRFALAPKAVE